MFSVAHNISLNFVYIVYIHPSHRWPWR